MHPFSVLLTDPPCVWAGGEWSQHAHYTDHCALCTAALCTGTCSLPSFAAWPGQATPAEVGFRLFLNACWLQRYGLGCQAFLASPILAEVTSNIVARYLNATTSAVHCEEGLGSTALHCPPRPHFNFTEKQTCPFSLSYPIFTTKW